MIRLVANRLWQGVLMLLALSLVVFALARMTGSPAALLLPPDATAEDVAEFETRLGLRDPMPVQFARFVGSAAVGDLGTSLRTKRPVFSMFLERLPATLHVLLFGVLIMSLGIPLGVAAALLRATGIDVAIRILASLGTSVPHFWLGTMLALVFGVWLRLLPVAGRGGWESAILPAVALSMYPMAGIARLVRSGMLQVLGQDYIFFARAKGMPERTVLFKHAMRNALVPVVAFAGIVIVTHFLLGAVVVETVFAWPGVGYLAYQSVIQRDYPVLQGVVLLMGLVFVIANLIVDLIHGYLDPRVRPS